MFVTENDGKKEEERNILASEDDAWLGTLSPDWEGHQYNVTPQKNYS